MNAANFTIRKPQSLLAMAAMVALLAVAPFAYGSANPFAALSGAWAGPGTVTVAGGAKETIRCRANYNVDGANLRLDLRCSGNSYKFELQSNVTHSNGEVSGNWTEMTNRVGGTVAGKATPHRIEVRVDGAISALLAVSTRADQQMVSIKSPGGPMSAVTISLNRRMKQADAK
jgi:hypothetical protein